jgi:ESCRT-II complex subunit VPS25
LSSREKQLALWRELILTYHTRQKRNDLIVHDCALWRNARVRRQLTAEAIRTVCNDFVRSGHGEWADAQKTQIRILWRKPEQLATDIYKWAGANGLVGSVCTIYELHSGEDVSGTSFQGADEELLRRALAILEEQGKCVVFKGETSEEDGIKFS